MSPRVVAFHYTLTGPSGEVLDSSQGQEPLSYIEGLGQIIPGLEVELQALKTGDKKKIQVPAAQAYGERDENLRLPVPRDRFAGQEIKVGDQFRSGDHPDAPPLTVVEVNDKAIVMDANHPLAGMDLTFDVEITDQREATQEELSHGHVHGEGGHHH